MLKAFASVDWSDLSRCYCGALMADPCHTFVGALRCDITAVMPLAMVTLTYPGNWLAVAPTGKDAKRHLANFRRRWAHAWGWRLDGAWKQEFQSHRRPGGSEGERAPPFHLPMPVTTLVTVLPIRWALS